jgi:hypothetical protein
MNSFSIRKVLLNTLAAVSILAIMPIGAHAELKRDSNGWWNKEGNSYSIGWKNIDGEWYYFDNNGYMKTGWIQSDNKWYYLYDCGTMARNTNINGNVDYEGVWHKSDANEKSSTDEILDAKPVIYLYPKEKTDINVKLDYKGEITCLYPKYNKDNIWEVTAYPDGKIINKLDNKEYSYLYWEGSSENNYDFSKGFVVKGDDTAEFLQEKLEYLGLNSRESDDFITYWLPKMNKNKYNLISFQKEEYTDKAKLNISPAPDSMLRVFMAFKPLDNEITIPKQELEKFDRKAFSVVEWGGCEVK